MRNRETLLMVGAALAAVLGALALVVGARLNFSHLRPEPHVAILDTLPETPDALAFAIDGSDPPHRRYRLGPETLEISGWAYDRRMKMPFAGGAILIDGAPQRLVYGTPSAAVALQAGSPSLVDAGWYVRLLPHSLSAGSHAVRFSFVSRDGTHVEVTPVVATIVASG